MNFHISIPLPVKLEVAYLHGNRLPQRTIAYKTDISKSSVNRIIQLIGKKEEKEIKCNFNSQLKYHFVLFNVMLNPFITNKQISNFLQKYDFRFSESTASRTVRDLKIKTRTQKPKEKLTLEHKKNRVIFSMNILKSELYLLPITFSDESMICLEPF